ncbi:uncharacterized protein LOC131981525 [Centropristis striata]|uniref:uncharacterized protein LOC131981525 n=1 Tax=Centropristis striata TaxID=184440 RepID=UPI0027E0E322|nr:uncharacterized protein LOC131981525 [Centropristis striata]
MEEEEEEAVRNYCRRMIPRVRDKHLCSSSEEESRRHKGARERQRTHCERQVVAGDVFRHHRECNLPLPDCTTGEKGDQTSPNLICQGPEVHTVPPQLILMLRLKTFKEEMKRAAEVELHDPAVCSVCEQEQASLALRSFIWRKKTQLRFQTVTQTKHTHCGYREWGRPAMPLDGFGRNYLEMCGSQQPDVALATAKERGVALATDEMRGYPDKNATGTHLARPRCPFPDR